MNEHEKQQETTQNARIEALEARVESLSRAMITVTDLFQQQQELNKTLGKAVGAL